MGRVPWVWHMSVLHFLYLTRPYPWNVGNVYFTFLLCVTALCMIYVYMCVWGGGGGGGGGVGDRAFCMMNSRGYVSNPL